MLTHRSLELLLWPFLVATLITGCSPARTPPGANSIGVSFEDKLYSYHYWDEGLAILIWHDFSYGESGCRGTSSTEDPLYRLTCEVEAWDGRRFDWKVTTQDGKTGQLWIDGVSYPFAKGTVFLVSSPDGRTQVVQLARDLSVLIPDNEAIIAWAKSDPEIAAFLGRTPVEEIPGEILSDEDAARVALITFFDHLHAGEYAAAADLYGGSYDIMVDHNPMLDPSDHPALWRAACTVNGAQCFQVASAQLQNNAQVPEGEFEFAVEFLREDGTIFSQGPCCGEDLVDGIERNTFVFRVRKIAEYYFQVLDPPVYLP